MTELQSPKDRIVIRNGYEIPCMGFGTWKIPNDDTGVEAVQQALADDYRHIDTAAAYGNEEMVGKAIAASDVPRKELFVTSKVWNADRGYETTRRAFDATLEKLGLEYLDLYLIHWPASQGTDPDWKRTNQETWRALESLYLEERIRAIGVSNFRSDHLEALMDAADVLPMINQIEFHPGCSQQATREFCLRNDILVEAWSPLAHGRILQDEQLTELSALYGCTVAQLCIRWCMQKHAIPLPKSVNAGRIAENARVFWFHISDEDMQRLDELDPLGQSGLDPDTIDF